MTKVMSDPIEAPSSKYKSQRLTQSHELANESGKFETYWHVAMQRSFLPTLTFIAWSEANAIENKATIIVSIVNGFAPDFLLEA